MQTIEEIRRSRLEELVREQGSAARLARAIDKSPAQISQWLNRSPDSKTGKPRAMGGNAAREIEAALGKPAGWLDQPPPQGRRLDTLEPTVRALTSESAPTLDQAIRALALALEGAGAVQRQTAADLLAGFATKPETAEFVAKALAAVLEPSGS